MFWFARVGCASETGLFSHLMGDFCYKKKKKRRNKSEKIAKCVELSKSVAAIKIEKLFDNNTKSRKGVFYLRISWIILNES